MTSNSLADLQAVMLKQEKSRKVRDDLLQSATESLNNNIKELGEAIKNNAKILKDYQRDQGPIMAGIKGFFADKKSEISDKLKGTNLLRSIFGIKEGSGTLADSIVKGLERTQQLRQEKKDFADDYMQFNKKGIAQKNLLGEKETRKIADELYKEIKKKQAEIAAAEMKVQRGADSVFGRPLKKDQDLLRDLKDELQQLISPGFKPPKTTDSNERLLEKTQVKHKDDLSEEQIEAAKEAKKNTQLLEQIEVNTRSGEVRSSRSNMVTGGIGSILGGAGLRNIFGSLGGGLLKGLGSIVGGLASGLVKALGFVLSPANILKAVTKVFLPVAIVASIAKGIYDGFKEYQESGSIKEALIAGFGGILEFISFGLFDKETIKGILPKISGFVDEYIVQPVTGLIDWVGTAFKEYIADPIKNMFEKIGTFFKDTYSSFINFFRGIEIPAIKIDLPGTALDTTLGPWKPFADSAKPAPAVIPSQARQIESATKQVEEAKTKQIQAPIAAPTVVSAPTTINKSSTNMFSNRSVRNQESTVNRFIQSRVFAL